MRPTSVRCLFRPWRPDDSSACLAMFDSNVPTYFALAERPEYEAFLAAMPCAYLVGEIAGGDVVACGGYFREPGEAGIAGEAGLAWGMVHRDWHRRGLGRQLLVARLGGVQSLEGVCALVLRTSQHTEGFYARAGFAVTGRIIDGHAPGIDRVEMRCPIRAASAP